MSRRYTNGVFLTAGVIAALACMGSASACPVCDSATADEVRAGLTADGMGKTIAAMVAPFVVLVAGVRIYNVGLLHFFRFQPSKS